MSTPLIQNTDCLIPLAPPRVQSTRSCTLGRLEGIRSWLRHWLPSITTRQKAVEDLATGYNQKAWRCIAKKDLVGACHNRLCARVIREQIGIR